MATKKLLVASVFGPSDHNQTWIDLQLRFLRRTTVDFDHAVYLNRVSAEMFPDSIIIEQCDLPFEHGKVDTSRGLNGIMTFFRQNPDYENYLILDSDAFPVTEGWLENLLALMKGAKPREKQFAAAVRTENLDTFPHHCAFFIRGEFLHKRRFLRQPNFDFRRPSRWRQPWPYTNLIGARVRDCASGISPYYRGRHVLYPLLRTNVWNPDPIRAAIYGGLFYHHTAGTRRHSRHRLDRLVQAGGDRLPRHAGSHLVERVRSHSAMQETDQLYTSLLADPDTWIAQLTGRASRPDRAFDSSALGENTINVQA